MIGLLITGYLLMTLSLSTLFEVFGYILLLALIPVLLLPEKLFKVRLPEPKSIFKEMKVRILPTTETGSSKLHEHGLIYLYLGITLRVICIVGFASFLPVFLTEELQYSLSFLGLFSAVDSGIMILGSRIISRNFGTSPRIFLASARGEE